MNLKLLVLFVSLLVFIRPIMSQDIQECFCDSVHSKHRNLILYGDEFLTPRASEGSQFFKIEWIPGTVYRSDHSVVDNVDLKYNGYIDELIYLEPNSLAQVKIDKELISGFSLNDIKKHAIYNFTKIKIKKDFTSDSSIIFGQILYSGKLSLFEYQRIVYGDPKQLDKTTYYKDIYIPSPVYYLRLPSGRTVGFKTLKKKSLFNIFPEKADIIRKALKERKQRRFKTETDLISVTEILNTVLQ